MAILNLTQHNATPEQIDAGVIELQPEVKQVLKGLLDFQELPTSEEVVLRAIAITKIAKEHGASTAMIGGAPFLMSVLEDILRNNDVVPLYAFSQRISVEKLIDGTVVKTSEFKHVGFVEV